MQFDVKVAEDHAKELLPKDHPQNREANKWELAAETLQQMRVLFNYDDAAVYVHLLACIMDAADSENWERHTNLLNAEELLKGTIVNKWMQGQGYYYETEGEQRRWKKYGKSAENDTIMQRK